MRVQLVIVLSFESNFTTVLCMRPFFRLIKVTFLVLFAVTLFLAGWAFWWEPSSLVIRKYEIPLDSWPHSMKELRIAVLTDLHVGSPFSGLNKLRKIVSATNGQQPDLILLLGDYVIHGIRGGQFVSAEEFAPVLKTLSAPLGVYAVLGNHDHWYDAGRIRIAFEGNGIPVIDDQVKKLEHEGAPFWLAGISDFTTAPHLIGPTLALINDESPVILMTHHPDIFPLIPQRVSLTLAGHTHGGQVNLPLLGRLVVPSRYGSRYAVGWIRENGQNFFVSPGLGMSVFPVRFRVPPEISLLTIRSSE